MSETGSLVTASSSGESDANLTSARGNPPLPGAARFDLCPDCVLSLIDW
jgi:hypothetical protein